MEPTAWEQKISAIRDSIQSKVNVSVEIEKVSNESNSLNPLYLFNINNDNRMTPILTSSDMIESLFILEECGHIDSAVKEISDSVIYEIYRERHEYLIDEQRAKLKGVPQSYCF